MTFPVEGWDYHIYLVPMPPHIHACVVLGADGVYTIYLDQNRDFLSRLDDWTHEIWHILNDDFYNGEPIWVVEKRAS